MTPKLSKRRKSIPGQLRRLDPTHKLRREVRQKVRREDKRIAWEKAMEEID